MTKAQWAMNTEICPLYLVASEKGLQGILWKKQSVPMLKNLEENSPEARVLKTTVRQLEEYFAGKRTNFDLPFDIDGTPFQKKVWEELSKIPYGKTCSYGDIARKIKKSKAYRAVGTANGRNPISIVVPCHRVVASDGSLGGYAGSLGVKKKLLELERIDA